MVLALVQANSQFYPALPSTPARMQPPSQFHARGAGSNQIDQEFGDMACDKALARAEQTGEEGVLHLEIVFAGKLKNAKTTVSSTELESAWHHLACIQPVDNK